MDGEKHKCLSENSFQKVQEELEKSTMPTLALRRLMRRKRRN